MTYQDAIDEIFGMVNVEWNAASAAIIGYVPEIRWPGAAKSAKPDPLKVWGRVSTRVVQDAQSTLTDGNGTGKKRYTYIGLVFVQIFVPRSVAGMLDKARTLALDTRDLFRQASPSSLIWFRDQKIIEPQDSDDKESDYMFTVVATFQFDSIS